MYNFDKNKNEIKKRYVVLRVYKRDVILDREVGFELRFEG